MPGDRPPEEVRVAAVVVTYAAPPGMLEEAVSSLVSERGSLAAVVVVDNGSEARERLRRSGVLGAVDVIETGANLGFGGAANVGFRRALERGADVVVLLNDDAVVADGWLAPLLAELSSDACVGAVQPLVVQHGSDPETVNGAGVEIDRYGAGSDRMRGAPVAAVGGPVDLAAVTGGAAAFSAAFLRDVGGFDERYFLYYEDVDLCRRGARAGWRFRLAPGSRVYHVGGATTSGLGTERLFLQERNRLWCSVTHGSPRELVEAIWLSLRRLRHEPRAVHGRSLLTALAGAASRLGRRVVRRPARFPLEVEAAPSGRDVSAI